METTERKPMESIAEYAKELRSLDEKVTELNAELEGVKKQRSKVSDLIVEEVNRIQDPNSAEPLTALVVDGVGVVKLNTAPHPRIIDLDAFIKWAKENNVMPPALSINAKTLESWWKEETKINQPLPPETIASVFWKTTARVNKGL